ncbi:MAG: hypothetical protein ACPGVS_09755, partial [Primorskyibacter sp.]
MPTDLIRALHHLESEIAKCPRAIRNEVTAELSQCLMRLCALPQDGHAPRPAPRRHLRAVAQSDDSFD